MSMADILKAYTELASLKATTDNLRQDFSRLELKVDRLTDRIHDKLTTYTSKISTLEAEQKNVKENIKSQLIGELKAEIETTKLRLDWANSKSLREDSDS